MGLTARVRVGAGGTLRQKLDGRPRVSPSFPRARPASPPGGSNGGSGRSEELEPSGWHTGAHYRATRTPSRRPERGRPGLSGALRAVLTNHHDVELEALLHGLPAHLLQDGVDAHVAKVHGGLLIPRRRCRLEPGVPGGVSHVASAAGSCLGGCGKKGRGVRGAPRPLHPPAAPTSGSISQTGKLRLSCPETSEENLAPKPSSRCHTKGTHCWQPRRRPARRAPPGPSDHLHARLLSARRPRPLLIT